MCNACGNVCCGSDAFSGCGCDGCHNPDCWSDDNDFSEDFDDGLYGGGQEEVEIIRGRHPLEPRP